MNCMFGMQVSANSSGIKRKGKFLGLTETGTKNAGRFSTGIDHLKELGVTHIHLLPTYDFNTVDESQLDSPQYNWGYDPLNYNTPEGSYSTNRGMVLPVSGNSRADQNHAWQRTSGSHGRCI